MVPTPLNEPILIHLRDGQLVVERWPERSEFDIAFLDVGEPGMLVRDADLIKIELANGRAVYEITEEDTQLGRVVARLIASDIWEWES